MSIKDLNLRRYYWNRYRVPMVRPLTICIAAICESETTNPKIVIASDGQITTPLLQFESGASKVVILDKHCYIMIATNNVPKGFTVIQTIKEKVKNKNMRVREIVELASEEFRNAWTKSIENNVLSIYGLDYKKFVEDSKDLSEDLINIVSHEVRNYEYNFESNFIIFGIDAHDNKPYIYTMNELGDYSSENFSGFAITGAGWPLALAEIAKYPYLSSGALSETLFRVFSAKRSAERAGGVGKTTDIFILDKFKLEGENTEKYGLIPVSKEVSEIIMKGADELEKSDFTIYKSYIGELQAHFDKLRKQMEDKKKEKDKGG